MNYSKEVLPLGQIFNGKFYCEASKQLIKGIRDKHPYKRKNNNYFLLQEHFRSHITHCSAIPDIQKHYKHYYFTDFFPNGFSFSQKWNIKFERF